MPLFLELNTVKIKLVYDFRIIYFYKFNPSYNNLSAFHHYIYKNQILMNCVWCFNHVNYPKQKYWCLQVFSGSRNHQDGLLVYWSHSLCAHFAERQLVCAQMFKP